MRYNIENDSSEYWGYGEDMVETIPAEEFFVTYRSMKVLILLYEKSRC